MNDISWKWEKSFPTFVILIAYILCNDQWICLIFGTQAKKNTTFDPTDGYCQILVTFWAIWRQNFDNFILGDTVFGLVLSHWLAKSFSVPFLVELMRLIGNACIVNFWKHFEIGKCVSKAYIFSRLCISGKKTLHHIFFSFFFEKVWYQSLKWYQKLRRPVAL